MNSTNRGRFKASAALVAVAAVVFVSVFAGNSAYAADDETTPAAPTTSVEAPELEPSDPAQLDETGASETTTDLASEEEAGTGADEAPQSGAESTETSNSEPAGASQSEPVGNGLESTPESDQPAEPLADAPVTQPVTPVTEAPAEMAPATKPTPQASLENFSVVPACVDTTHGLRPGVRMNADVVVPEGADAATVHIGAAPFATVYEEVFASSGQVDHGASLPVGNYDFVISLNGVVQDSSNVSITADLCDDPEPTPQASIENFSVEAICVDGQEPGARASVDVVVPEGAKPATVLLTLTQLGGETGNFSPEKTFTSSGNLSQVNTMPLGEYSIGVNLNGVGLASSNVSITASLCEGPPPTPQASIVNFSVKAICVDTTYGPRPGVRMNADVVVPEGADAATVHIGAAPFETVYEDTFEVSGKVMQDISLPVANYSFIISLNGNEVDSKKVAVTKDLCDSSTPTPTPTPTPEPTATPTPVPPAVNDGGGNPPVAGGHDYTEPSGYTDGLAETGAAPWIPGILGLLLAGGGVIALMVRRKLAVQK